MTWLFLFSLHIPFHSIFHYHYLIFTLSHHYFPMNPSISAYLLLYSFTHPFSSSIHSILVILTFVRRNSASLLLFFKTPVLSSPVQIPLSQNLPSFLRNYFRILFVVPFETQRTPAGGKPKHFSKLSSDVVLWEYELDSLTSQMILWNQSSTRGSAHIHLWPLYLSFSLLVFPVASLPVSLHWISKKMGEAAVIFLLFSCTDCKSVKLWHKEELLSYKAGMWPNLRLLLPCILIRWSTWAEGIP